MKLLFQNPVSTSFSRLAVKTKSMDPTRLITAAMERHYIDNNTIMIDDPFGDIVDVLGCNSYIGWYDGLPEKCKTITWRKRFMTNQL